MIKFTADLGILNGHKHETDQDGSRLIKRDSQLEQIETKKINQGWLKRIEWVKTDQGRSKLIRSDQD